MSLTMFDVSRLVQHYGLTTEEVHRVDRARLTVEALDGLDAEDLRSLSDVCALIDRVATVLGA